MKLLFLALLFMAAIVPPSPHPAKLPRPAHIIIVIEENHGYDEVVNSPDAPFINKLARGGALFTNSHGVTHPSQPNYLALFSGSTQGVPADGCLGNETPYHTPNLASALINKQLTFRGFAETMPSVGYLDCQYLNSSITGAYLYARKHAPWVNWQGVGINNIPGAFSLPLTSFPKDFNQLPTVAFVIPDMDHDMHNIGPPGDGAAIQRGDHWLKEHLQAYAQWAKTHNSLLIITFDEDDFKLVNHIPTLFFGGMIKPGKYDEHINHYNVLHTIEAMYGLPVADTASAKVINGAWK